MERFAPAQLQSGCAMSKQFPVRNDSFHQELGSYCDLAYQLDSGLKSTSSKRIRLDFQNDVSPTSTDIGVSRCNSPSGVSNSTGNGSRSSSPIDVLGFDSNYTILAPPVALRKAMNGDMGVMGLQRSSPGNQSDDNGKRLPSLIAGSKASSSSTAPTQAPAPFAIQEACTSSDLKEKVQRTRNKNRNFFTEKWSWRTEKWQW